MDFHNLAYWQEKANNIAIETRLFINGEYSAAADNSVFATVDPTAQQTLAEVARGKKGDVDRRGPGRPRRLRSRRLVAGLPCPAQSGAA
ncbi:Gamma-glutamyl-aminobutyraldehyde dehydrogenase [Klebsiella michiganensis]|nr:Gamma-glutamyl-aminobutyraldehyde dehydrogenase [Klebsiella michiganensis]